jgi:FKBP-type peptidyl-prolyl cis-trans isomerase 2
MKIEENRVVRFHYTVSEAGREVESSRAGERFEVEVSPEEGYGPRREEHTQRHASPTSSTHCSSAAGSSSRWRCKGR